MINDAIRKLNNSQREAVDHDGNLLVLAGAGSGKTRVVVVKIAKMITDGARPSKILAVTFTNKAAKEMKERLIKMHSRGALVNMSTFHSFGARFLREHCSNIGRTKSFSIWSESNQASAIRNIINRDKKAFERIEGSDAIKGRVSDVAKWISSLKDSSVEPVIPLDPYSTTEAQRFIFKEYEKLLVSSNAVDFADLIRLTVIIMHRDNSLIPQYEHVLVDELQDTNSSQFSLLILLAKKVSTITGVGDDDQSIYEWRGAVAKNVTQFMQRFNAKLVKLRENYRSNALIVNSANDLISNNFERMGKDMVPAREEGNPVYYIESEDQLQEASRIASTVAAYSNENPDGKVAILYRENRQSRTIEHALRRLQIPYILYKGIDFVSRREISLMLNIFRLLVNHKDNQAFTSVVSHLCKGFGPKTLSMLEQWQFSSTADELFTGDGAPLSPMKLKEYKCGMMLLSQIRDADNLIDVGFKVSPALMKKASRFPGDKIEMTIDREANIHELFVWMQEYQGDNTEATLSDFMNEASLDTSSANKDTDAVAHLMTVHGSKGLEFPVVIVAGCSQSMFPGNATTTSEYEESRRLMYVAMTRAEDVLMLSHPVMTHKGASERSEFLDDIDDHLMRI